MFDRLEVVVERIDQGNSGRNVEADNLFVRDSVKILDESAERVSVSRNQNLLAGSDVFLDGALVEGNDAVDRDLERFSQRNDARIFVCVAGFLARIAFVGFFEGRRRDVKGTTPDLDLGFAVLFGGFGLVQSLQRAVVTFVQAPVLDDRNPFFVHFFEDVIASVDCALQVRRVSDIEGEAFFLQQLAAELCFLVTGFGKIGIAPAGEKILEVPFGFAVADQDEFVAHVVFLSIWFDLNWCNFGQEYRK